MNPVLRESNSRPIPPPKFYTASGAEVRDKSAQIQRLAQTRIQDIVNTDWFRRTFEPHLFSDAPEGTSTVRATVKLEKGRVTVTLSNGTEVSADADTSRTVSSIIKQPLKAINSADTPLPREVPSASGLPSGGPIHAIASTRTVSLPPTTITPPPSGIPSNRWYTDDDINFLLKERTRHLDRGNIAILAAIDADLHAGQTLGDNIRSRIAEEAQQPSPAGHLMIPINLGNSHWVSVVINRSQEVPHVTYFDPLGRPLPDVVKEALEEVLTEDTSFEAPTERFQTDGYNCGPWCVAFLEQMIRNKDHQLPSIIPTLEALQVVRDTTGIENRRREDMRLIEQRAPNS